MATILPDGSSMRRGGRYLVQKRGGGLLDVWCCEVTQGGYVRLKRRDRVHEWFSVQGIFVLEVLADPPPIPESVPSDDGDLDEPAHRGDRFDAYPQIQASDLPSKVMEDIRTSIVRCRHRRPEVKDPMIAVTHTSWPSAMKLPDPPWRCDVDGVRVVCIADADQPFIPGAEASPR